MDWDEPKAKTAKGFLVGEDLARLSVTELDERIALLKAEITRIEKTMAKKKQTTAAAAALFGKG
jgi:uncharacterized small protein (DUF1192 family)